MAYTTDEVPQIFYGEPFTDRKSKFQAYCAVCKSLQDVCLFRDTLLENPKIEDATHNILAWVTEEDSGFDDDGEAHAGTQVLQMLEKAGAQNVAVMISRWFGGIMLYGDRFRDITGAALKVLKENGLLENRKAPQSKKKKRKNKE